MSDAEEQILRLVWQEHGRALKAATLRWTSGDHADADDVMQETLVRLWQNREVIDEGRGSLRRWLFVVAQNICIDRYRRRRARPAEVAEGGERVDPSARDHAELVDTTLQVRAALDVLNPDQREVIERLYLKDQTLAQIATDLSIPLGTVKSRAYYALRNMQAVMKPNEVQG
jgi:RNA polymerase sigma-70 factor, ECF subfamily